MKLGPRVQQMTDQEILARHKEVIEAWERLRDEYERVAIEIPPGRPQIEYVDEGPQWTPRGDVLRCVISDGGPGDEPIIHIDEHDLPLRGGGWRRRGRRPT